MLVLAPMGSFSAEIVVLVEWSEDFLVRLFFVCFTLNIQAPTWGHAGASYSGFPSRRYTNTKAMMSISSPPISPGCTFWDHSPCLVARWCLPLRLTDLPSLNLWGLSHALHTVHYLSPLFVRHAIADLLEMFNVR